MVEKLIYDDLEEKVLHAGEPVVIDFWNTGCGPCQALEPVIEEISNEKKEIKFFSVNIAEGEKLVDYFGVMAAPTLLFIKDGTVQKKAIGFKSKESIRDIISQYF